MPVLYRGCPRLEMFQAASAAFFFWTHIHTGMKNSRMTTPRIAGTTESPDAT